MNIEYSGSELLSFLEYLSDKNLINPSTASAKKAAVVKVLSAISDEEKHDLRTLDRDQVFQRFSNKYAKEFTSESLVTYKSRFNSVLTDFFSFKENPAGFKTGGFKKPPKESSGSAKSTGKKSQIQKISSAAPPLPYNEHRSYVLQIPISENRLVEIRNLPMDLTVNDAKKIAAVISAHAPANTIQDKKT